MGFIAIEVPGILEVGAGTHLDVGGGTIWFLQIAKGFEEIRDDPRYAIYTIVVRVGLEVVIEALLVGFPIADVDNGGTDAGVGDEGDVIVRPSLKLGAASDLDGPGNDRAHHSRICRHRRISDGDKYRFVRRIPLARIVDGDSSHHAISDISGVDDNGGGLEIRRGVRGQLYGHRGRMVGIISGATSCEGDIIDVAIIEMEREGGGGAVGV